MAIPGAGDAAFQPICADDVAACVMAALPGGPAADAAAGARYELAGPETLTHREIVALALRSFGRRRPIVGVPMWLTRRDPQDRRAAGRTDGIRHLGRGRAARDPARRRTRDRRRRGARASPHGRWRRCWVAKRAAPAHGSARSSCAARASSSSSRAGRPDELDPGGQAVVALVEREHDRRQAHHVDDRRVGGERARAPVVAPRVGPAAVDLAGQHRPPPSPGVTTTSKRCSSATRPRATRSSVPCAASWVIVFWSRACSQIFQVSGSTSSLGGLAAGDPAADERGHRGRRPEGPREVRQQPAARPRRVELLHVVAQGLEQRSRRRARRPR